MISRAEPALPEAILLLTQLSRSTPVALLALTLGCGSTTETPDAGMVQMDAMVATRDVKLTSGTSTMLVILP